MRSDRIQERIHWGLNRAARAAGTWANAYRPSGSRKPVSDDNLFIRLPAIFSGARGGFASPNVYGMPMCEGIFDAGYTKPGDYLVRGEGTWFIASQEPLLPILCVRTNLTVSFWRVANTFGANGSDYGSIDPAKRECLIESWPASVLGDSAARGMARQLPSDEQLPRETVLLPVTVPVPLRPGDLMMDELGREAVVVAAERSALGWRMSVEQAST